MDLQSALLNWLQIKTVAEARPEDQAAKETSDFFEVILKEDHKLERFEITNVDETTYFVEYVKEGKVETQKFDRMMIDVLLEEINSNPKYNE